MLPVNLFLFDRVQRRRAAEALNIERRIMRNNSSPFMLPDKRFMELFRITKDMAHYIMNTLSPYLLTSAKLNAIPVELNIFAALTFYATGNYQRNTGQGYLLSMSQQSVGRAIQEVSTLLCELLGNEHIVFPTNPQTKLRLKQLFLNKTGFPGTLGAVDCTHVAMLTPKVEEHNYQNRKGYHSKNVQIVCDYNLKILSINARYGGASHDSFIWNNSRVKDELQRCHAEGERNTWLVGDSGYPLQPWLMTPILNARIGSPEDRYNQAHSSTRNCIERCNGVLKTRFRCLLGERTLRYGPEATGKIITTACAILHNICVDGRLDIEEHLDIDMPKGANVGEVGLDHMVHEGRNIRQNIINNYFT